MADKCECGHYEPSHQFQGKHCNICPCEKFTKEEPDDPDTTPPPIGVHNFLVPSSAPRYGIIEILDSITKTLQENKHQEAADYVSGYRDTIETQPAVTREPLSHTETGGVLLVLDMLSRSHECWCAAGTSDLIPDHNEICVKVRALYQSIGQKGGEKQG